MDNNWIEQLNAGSGTILNAASVYANVADSKDARHFAKHQYDKAREDNLKDLEDARRYAERMWTMENEYNSPLNQLKRMEEAGINPNNAAPAIAGVSASSSVANPTTPNATSIPNPVYSNISANFAAAAQTAKELALIDAQIENINADTANKQANTEHTYVDAQKVGQELVGIIYDNNVLKPKEVEQIEATIQKTFADKELTDQERKESVERTNTFIEQVRNLIQERKNLQEQINLLKAQEQTEETKQELNRAQSALDDSNKQYQDLINQYESDLQELGSSTQEKGSQPDVMWKRTNIRENRKKKEEERKRFYQHNRSFRPSSTSNSSKVSQWVRKNVFKMPE